MPYEQEIPAKRETYEAQVLVITRPYNKMVPPLLGIPMLAAYSTFEETQRVLRGAYRVELVPSHLVAGRPTLIIYEEVSEEAGHQ